MRTRLTVFSFIVLSNLITVVEHIKQWKSDLLWPRACFGSMIHRGVSRDAGIDINSSSFKLI